MLNKNFQKNLILIRISWEPIKKHESKLNIINGDSSRNPKEVCPFCSFAIAHDPQ